MSGVEQSDEDFVKDMSQAEGLATKAINQWMREVCAVQDNRNLLLGLLPAFAAALGKAAAATAEVEGRPGTAGLYEDAMLAYFRWGFRGTKDGPVEQDGSPWSGVQGEA